MTPGISCAAARLICNIYPLFTLLQVALDDVNWDMFRASSSDITEFIDVALSFVNTQTEQATEKITIRTFPNQKPWVNFQYYIPHLASF